MFGTCFSILTSVLTAEIQELQISIQSRPKISSINIMLGSWHIANQAITKQCSFVSKKCISFKIPHPTAASTIYLNLFIDKFTSDQVWNHCWSSLTEKYRKLSRVEKSLKKNRFTYFGIPCVLYKMGWQGVYQMAYLNNKT